MLRRAHHRTGADNTAMVSSSSKRNTPSQNTPRSDIMPIGTVQNGMAHTDIGRVALTTNYIVDATDHAGTNLKWTSTTVQTYTVPAGTYWILWGGQVTRDANETLVVNLTDGTNTIMNLATAGAATGQTDLLEDLPGKYHMPMILPAGYEVVITCGGAQGAGAKATCVVNEITL